MLQSVYLTPKERAKLLHVLVVACILPSERNAVDEEETKIGFQMHTSCMQIHNYLLVEMERGACFKFISSQRLMPLASWHNWYSVKSILL